MTEPARITLYWSAIWRAAVTTITFAVPLSLAQTILIDRGEIEKSDPVNYLLYLAIMFCGALGGFAAAKLAPRSMLENGAASGALAAIVIQVAGAIRRAFADEPISNPLGWILLAFLMATFAMFGAMVHRATSPKEETPT